MSLSSFTADGKSKSNKKILHDEYKALYDQFCNPVRNLSREELRQKLSELTTNELISFHHNVINPWIIYLGRTDIKPINGETYKKPVILDRVLKALVSIPDILDNEKLCKFLFPGENIEEFMDESHPNFPLKQRLKELQRLINDYYNTKLQIPGDPVFEQMIFEEMSLLKMISQNDHTPSSSSSSSKSKSSPPQIIRSTFSSSSLSSSTPRNKFNSGSRSSSGNSLL